MWLSILAAEEPVEIVKVAEAAKEATPTITNWVQQPWNMPDQVNLLNWAQGLNPAAACLLLGAGIVYLMFGVTMFKWLVTLNAAVVGAFFGALIGKNGDAAIAGAFMGGFSAAAATWPLMKYAVTIMGGLFGLLLGITVWRSAGLDPAYAWSGGLSGLIFFGMLNFVLFRISIMAYTSLQGSVMLLFGVLALAYKWPEVAPKVTDLMTFKPFIMPALVVVPTVIGMFWQASYGAGEADAKKK
jgi:hypothetical protein